MIYSSYAWFFKICLKIHIKDLWMNLVAFGKINESLREVVRENLHPIEKYNITVGKSSRFSVFCLVSCKLWRTQLTKKFWREGKRQAILGNSTVIQVGGSFLTWDGKTRVKLRRISQHDLIKWLRITKRQSIINDLNGGFLEMGQVFFLLRNGDLYTTVGGLIFHFYPPSQKEKYSAEKRKSPKKTTHNERWKRAQLGKCHILFRWGFP